VSETVGTERPSLLGTARPLYAEYDLALLDLDGVVYIGPDVVPGAAEALDRVRELGMPVRFVTNNASRSPDSVAEHLTRLGVPAGRAEVVTSAQVAAALLAHRLPAGSGVLVVGGAGLREALTAEGLVPMDSVDQGPAAVVQGFSPDIGWRMLAEGTRAVRSGLFWMATNLDLTFPTIYGPAPGNGSLVRAVATAAGREPDDVAGKPRPGAFLEAARQAGSNHPLVIGDRLDTDLEGAQAAGMPGLLVLTGLTGAADLLTAEPHLRPDLLARDLGGLLVEHPAATVTDVSGTLARGSCRAASVQVRFGTGPAAVEVLDDGGDALDLLRAATVAAWAVRDLQPDAELDPTAMIDRIRAMEPDAGWAR
jgi:HAD superfamily hydrolase (TIGR01450 family)